MVKFLINRPVAVIMTFFALLLLGLYSSFLLPVSLLPDINIPEITVRVSYPGKPSLEMEQTVVSPLRLQLMQISGLDDLESEVRDGEGTIRLKFDYGSNIDYIFIEVNEKVDMAMADLPREVPRPRVIKASASDLPVFYINLSYIDTANHSPSQMLELSQLASKVIRKRIEQLPEVALADITGITSPELVITPNQTKLIALNISPEQIEQALKQSMFGMGSIRIREGQLIFDVIIEQKTTQPEDIGNISLNSHGRVFLLSELASIELKPSRSKGVYLYNGVHSVCIPVVKHAKARMSNLKKEAESLIDQFEKDYPDVKFSISHDQTLILDYSITNLRNTLIAGVILVVAVMFLFLGDYRNPILMGITIPVSLVVSIMFFYLTGLSVNIVSLSGLILGVGMMIDNSIVVIDNINQWRERSNALPEAVSRGTNEVIRPLLSSMLTTCAVFVPLAFLSGISGAMFRDQAIAVTIGLGVSFFVSITLLPTLYFTINQKGKETWISRKGLIPLEKSYEKGFRIVFFWRKPFLLLVVILVSFCPLLLFTIDKQQMPELTRTETIVEVSWGNNINVEENLKRCNQFIGEINDHLNESAFLIGEQQFLLNKNMDIAESDAHLYISFPSKISINMAEVMVEAWFRNNYPDAIVAFSNPETAFERIFPAPEARLVIGILGTDGNFLPTITDIDSVTQIIDQYGTDASYTTVPQQYQLFLCLNQRALSLYGISPVQVQQVVEVALQSNNVGSMSFEQQVIPIVFGDNPESLDKIIATTHVKNQSGIDIPLRALLDVEKRNGFRSIYGNKRGTIIPVKVNAPDRTIIEIMHRLNKFDSKNNGVNLMFTGDIFKSQIIFLELIGVLLVSVLLLYFILAAQFESLKQPLIVLLELPIDIAGALLLVWILGGSINVMTLIGLVVMGGIIVNDSILKIDTINRLRLQGLSLFDAIVEGGKRRLKPIVMTSLTTILALVPILFGHDLGSELQQPLALATIGGMIIGTLVSLFFIPLAYWWLYKAKQG